MRTLIFFLVLATPIATGCRVSRKNGKWSVGMKPTSELVSDLIWNGNDQQDQWRRFHDQTSDDPRR